MIAKLIVTGATRAEAIQRARRAVAEFVVEGIPTVLPFHEAVLNAPEFVAEDHFGVYTTWIETGFAETVRTLGASGAAAAGHDDGAATERVVVEVGGKRLEVVLPAALAQAGRARARAGAPTRRTTRKPSTMRASNGVTLSSPMQGTIVKVAVEDGATVAEGDLVVVLEAMKMEQPLIAHRSGVVTGLVAAVGTSVTAGAVICDIIDTVDTATA
jgi:acetyl-CoA/propionyl-CoA carboxylase biotin carboxyl carrier protein